MKKLLVVSLTLASFNLAAETFVTKIHSVNDSDGFIRLENGRVAFFKRPLTSGHVPSGSKVKISLNEDNELKSIEVLEETLEAGPQLKSLEAEERPSFTPSVIPDLKSATDLFNNLKSDFKRVSECTDRAHVWSYDLFKNNSIMSQKVFALFTASYINRNRFKWWFHVAPLVQVQEEGKVESRVLDFRYADRPLLIKEWTDMLVFSKRPCKMTTRFSEYDVNPQTEDCYMIIESMYYRLPGDIFEQELKNQYRDKFIESELNFSRKLGFENTTVRSNP